MTKSLIYLALIYRLKSRFHIKVMPNLIKKVKSENHFDLKKWNEFGSEFVLHG